MPLSQCECSPTTRHSDLDQKVSPTATPLATPSEYVGLPDLSWPHANSRPVSITFAATRSGRPLIALPSSRTPPAACLRSSSRFFASF
eukprot:CAMPEP_0183816036 /NCGR_PEP_ID=MMETSP0803_2-20130417/57938_1 /TAXON_ID=195967 /ORGANISM="Crustomastix stigmata, Strain CCMP3273" /LENGTH=87 /DNA_ID=CAMNT_0026060897 /DNA_START=285 /DNA_END=545 /DNA_ORIENTATION=-